MPNVYMVRYAIFKASRRKPVPPGLDRYNVLSASDSTPYREIHSTDKLIEAIYEPVELFPYKRVPWASDIKQLTQLIEQHPDDYGLATYKPHVPNSYKYEASGLFVEVNFVRHEGRTWMRCDYRLGSVTSSPYGKPTITCKTPKAKGNIIYNANPQLFEEYARQELNHYLSRFPWMKGFFNDYLASAVLPSQVILDDDGHIVLCNDSRLITSRVLLLTPIGTFTVYLPDASASLKKSPTIRGVLRHLKIPYTKKDRESTYLAIAMVGKPFSYEPRHPMPKWLEEV